MSEGQTNQINEEAVDEQRMRQQAYSQKYRLVTTIASKAVEAAQKCGIKINVVTYDQQLHKIKEYYTHDDLKLNSVMGMMVEGGQADDLIAMAASGEAQALARSGRKIKLQS